MDPGFRRDDKEKASAQTRGRHCEKHHAGVGASGSIKLSAFSSIQKVAGIGARKDAILAVTSLGRAAPGMIATTAGWASGNCRAAAGSRTPCRLHTASMLRTL